MRIETELTFSRTSQKMIRRSAVPLLLAGLLSGCYAEGNSHFLSSGAREYFLTLSRCEEEAKAAYTSGQAKYSGYECRSKLLWFTTQKRDYHEGKLVSASGK